LRSQMKPMHSIKILFCAVAVSSLPAQTFQSVEVTSTTYEELPELKASEILRDDILTGPYHHVREEVPTYSGANRFTIDSQFGVFEAEGNEMLLRRVNEINAIAKLKDVPAPMSTKTALSLRPRASPLPATLTIWSRAYVAPSVACRPRGPLQHLNCSTL
jgi:hypothetical protein